MYIGDTYNCDYLPHTIFGFYLTNFQISPSQFWGFFGVKSLNVTPKLVSQKMLLKTAKLVGFSLQNYSSNNSFTLF